MSLTTKERESEVEAGVAADRLSLTGETDLLELGPDLVTVTENLGREIIPGVVSAPRKASLG